jgi:hypothetical protein
MCPFKQTEFAMILIEVAESGCAWEREASDFQRTRTPNSMLRQNRLSDQSSLYKTSGLRP